MACWESGDRLADTVSGEAAATPFAASRDTMAGHESGAVFLAECVEEIRYFK